MVEQQGPVGPQFPKSAGRARALWVWTKRERCGGPEQPNRSLKAERQLGGLLEGPGEEPDSRQPAETLGWGSVVHPTLADPQP